jgi:exodeoxyribonuclease VII small subunit
MDKQSSYARTRERLEEIVAQVRAKDMPLEKSLDLYEEALRLGSACAEMIDRTDFSADEMRAAEAGAEDAAEAEAEDAAAEPGDDAGDEGDEGGPAEDDDGSDDDEADDADGFDDGFDDDDPGTDDEADGPEERG